MENNDLISRSALWKKFDEAHLFDDGNPRHIAQQIVEEEPAVDAATVVHGQWVAVPSSDMMTGKAYKCSECGKMRYGSFMPNYCQICGAKMDGEKDGRI